MLRFVNDDPDPAFVDTLAQTYLDNDTDIAPVLKQLFLSDEFNDLRRTKAAAAVRGRDGDRSNPWLRTSQERHRRPAFDVLDVHRDRSRTAVPGACPMDTRTTPSRWVSAGATLNRWNRHYSMAGHWAAHSLQADTVA